MDPKEVELRQLLDAKLKEAEGFIGEGKMDEAARAKDEAKEIRSKLDTYLEVKQMRSSVPAAEPPKAPAIDPSARSKDPKEQEEREYSRVFMKAFRKKDLSSDERSILEARKEQRAMSAGSNADGGYTVPQDIQTRINNYKRTLVALENLINVIPVTAPSGSRVFETVATMTALANISEATTISDMGNPKLETKTYSVKKYAGIMSVSDELLSDSDESIMNYLAGWIARKSVVTRNSLITTLLATLTKTTFADWKAIKKALNVTLDPMLSAGAAIVTNQDAFQLMDTWVDGQNRPLLKPDVSQPTSNLLFGKPVIVVPNTVLATTGTTTKLAPIIVGNLNELITMFERQGHEIASTNVGGGGFETDTTKIRVIEREDVQLIDSAAAVYGQLDVTTI
jgi:HK97 family phage major capsid protein